jgi:CBS domain-containing protein
VDRGCGACGGTPRRATLLQAGGGARGGHALMKMRKAGDIMSTTVITVRADALLTEAIETLLRWHISGLPVVDDEGRLIGMLTEHDLLNFAFSGHAADTKAEDAMSRDLVSFGPEATVEEIVNCFASKRVRRVPIVSGGRLVGIVSRRDILREMNRIYSTY